MGALKGLRVLDLSRVLAGPWASQTLGDLGADVVKIERPGGGDDTRAWGPPWLEGEEGDDRESAYFLCANRNKRSVVIDLRTEEGRARLRELALQADVLIENFKTGTTERYGLDYARLSEANPGLVYCSITGFGQTGPLAKRPGYDFLVQAMGGLMSITGEADGRPGAGPQKVGVALTDIMTGLYATIGILAALREREHSGRGQYIDLALLDVTAAALANQASNFLVGGQVPTRLGNAHPNIVPYQSFRARDRDFILAVGNDTQFAALAALLEHPEWARDPRFATNGARVQNRDGLTQRLSRCFETRDAADWLARLEAAGVPAGPVNTIDELFAEPQIQARGMCVTMQHPLDAELGLAANPLRLSRTPVTYRRPPPRLGEHDIDLKERLWEEE
jgi:crotonobetainyl-CoA:carnitine CoA-transferase CaiB-like acyl-CoA transferase